MIVKRKLIQSGFSGEEMEDIDGARGGSLYVPDAGVAENEEDYK